MTMYYYPFGKMIAQGYHLILRFVKDTIRAIRHPSGSMNVLLSFKSLIATQMRNRCVDHG